MIETTIPAATVKTLKSGPSGTQVLWRQADRVFDGALDLEGAEQMRFIDRACGGQKTLKSMVLELVECCEDDSLEEQASSKLASIQIDLDREYLGTDRIGPYRLVRELGRGGMGVVYLAERVDGLFDHRVAVKVLQVERVEQLGSRFEQERRILASLDHAGIARLLDGGSTPSGTPYLVMERVEGEAIDLFCADQRLSLDPRLRLFAEVCGAVGAAHRSLVIHRDIKPSNILVDVSGQPKLLDFGIAKLLQKDSGAAAQTTSHMLTLEWASPEQLDGRPTTVQSDVYQLGLLLHLLLTGRLPYRLAGLSPADQVAAICTHDVSRPSTLVRRLPRAELEALADEFDLVPERLGSKLAGDLDAILLKALRKDPRQRYESAAAFRADIENYLARRPVSARMPTLRYRATRFLDRHRGPVLATLLAVLAFVALGIFSVQRIAAERDLAQRAAERAEARGHDAEAAIEFLTGVLAQANPYERREGKEPTVREAMDLGLARLDTDLADAPLVRARVLTELAGVFEVLGEWRQGIELGTDAVRLWEAAGAGYDSELVEALLAVGMMQRHSADYVSGRQNLTRAIELQRQLDPEAPRLVKALSHLAIIEDMDGDLDTAKRLFDESLAVAERLPESENEAKAVLLSRLGVFYKNYGIGRNIPGALEKSEQFYLRGLEGYRADPELASRIPLLYINLANLYFEQTRFEDSEAAHRVALEGVEEWFGKEHPTYAISLSNLGNTLMELGRFQEAGTVLTEALDLREKLYGPDHPRVAVAVNRLGRLHMKQGRARDARPLFERALKIRQKVMKSDHQDLALTLASLGRCHAALGNKDTARSFFEDAIAIYERSGGFHKAEECRLEMAEQLTTDSTGSETGRRTHAS